MTSVHDRQINWLSRIGFGDANQAVKTLGPTGLGLWDPDQQRPVDTAAGEVIADVGRTADPDRTVRALDRLVEKSREPDIISSRIRTSPRLRTRLFAVLAASSAFGDHLATYPDHWEVLDRDEPQPSVTELTEELLSSLQAAGDDTSPPKIQAIGSGQVLVPIRATYRRRLLSIAGRDLTGELSMEAVSADLSDLAAAVVAAAYELSYREISAAATPCRLAVIAMGKCGGRELNYVSDVDLIFVAEPVNANINLDHDEADALRTASTVASRLMQTCAQIAWPIDVGLRPEGRAGPLVRTIASHETYYKRWARTWEFQALLKARPIAGDLELGQEYVRRIGPLVWTASQREEFVTDVQKMRRRVEQNVPAHLAEREVKLGPGGLRDVEFAVQLLQLVHGRADETLRNGSTLEALRALSRGGYVGRSDANALADSYRFLRTVEHRLQLQRLHRTHLIPHERASVQWLARAMGYRPDERGDVVTVFESERAAHAQQVRQLHEKLFYRPLLNAVARVSTEELRLTPEAARARLVALGFGSPEGALQHIGALTSGISRRAAIQRALVPVMLGMFADAPDPDSGLLAYRQVSEALQNRPWYLRLLRDVGQVTDRLATVLGTSRYIADLLMRAPEGLRMLADDNELRPRSIDNLEAIFRAAAARHHDPESAVATIRALRRHELLRVACADVLGDLDPLDVGEALAAICAATLHATLDVVLTELAADRTDRPIDMSIIAMGRFGGAEMSYASDADVLFLHEARPGISETEASRAALSVADRVQTLLVRPTPDPPLLVDANLRPEGKSGPLTRSLPSYAMYYKRWSSVWEAQALLRARPVAGDRALGATFVESIDPIRYPKDGLSPEHEREIRRLKARVDSERLPKGADPATHTKLGRGGLSDVEWTVQLLQLRHGWNQPELRTTRTLTALAAARDIGLLNRDDAHVLEAAWKVASRARNSITLVRNRPSDQLPHRGRDLAALARVFGYEPSDDPGEFLDSYLRATRRARAVVERIFYSSR